MTTYVGSVVVAPWATLEADCLGRMLQEIEISVSRDIRDDTAAVVLALVRQAEASGSDWLTRMILGCELPVLLIADAPDDPVVTFARELGVAGVVSWRRSCVDIGNAVRHVAAGRAVPANSVVSRRDPFTRLTGRERHVMALAAAGGHDAEIATQLGISTSTVRTYVQNALGKLGAPHRHAAAVMVRNSPLMAARVQEVDPQDRAVPLAAG